MVTGISTKGRLRTITNDIRTNRPDRPENRAPCQSKQRGQPKSRPTHNSRGSLPEREKNTHPKDGDPHQPPRNSNTVQFLLH